MEWQDIKTAPTDGREILVAFWDDLIAQDWLVQIVSAGRDEFEWDTGGMTRNVAPFTLWAPIPQLPQRAA